jgi:RNA polymerase subunit RPABC4/transcription elongation factor Spt4
MTMKETCPNCNTALEEGSKFCPECGTKIEIHQEEQPPSYETVYCPECGAKTTTEFTFCPECGKPVGAAEPVAVSSSKVENTSIVKTIFSKKINLMGLIAAAVLVVIILAAVLVVRGGGSEDKPYLIYVKDQELNFSYLTKIKPFEMTSSLSETGEEFSSYGYSLLSVYVFLSDDKRYIFYPDRVNGDDISYYWRDLKADNTKVDSAHKIDSEISGGNIVLTGDGNKFFYIKGEENRLYIYDRKSGEKSKLDENVTNYYVNEKGNYLIYETYDGVEYTVYEMSLKGLNGEATKLDSASSIEYAFPDSKSVYYIKDGTLYLKEDGKEKVKISSDVSQVISVVNEKSVYYLKHEAITSKLSGFINDDLADSDKAMVEPVYPTYPQEPAYPYESDYSTQEWVSNYWGSTWNSELSEWGYWDQETDWDAYNAAYTQYQSDYADWETECNRLRDEYDIAYSAYEDKFYRDDLRNAFDSEDNAVTYDKYMLYYWNNGKETAIASDIVLGDYFTNGLVAASSKIPAVIYQKYSVSNIVNQKMSELFSEYGDYFYSDIISELKEKVVSSRVISEETFLASGEKECTINSTDAINWKISDKGIVYYLDDYDSEKGYGVLMSAKIGNGTVEAPATLDEDVTGYMLGNGNNKVYYYKDVKDGSGDIYFDKKALATDVYISSIYNFKDSDSLLYYIDYSSSNYDGTLCCLKGNKQTKISDDVSSFVPVDETHIAYLLDYSSERQKGDLMLYKGSKKPVTIDTDVTSILSIYSIIW